MKLEEVKRKHLTLIKIENAHKHVSWNPIRIPLACLWAFLILSYVACATPHDARMRLVTGARLVQGGP
jgi:hypothetical protein